MGLSPIEINLLFNQSGDSAIEMLSIITPVYLEQIFSSSI